jgi:two-component system, OmpR family, alkaline phosphatase synthesis response regulator PhoP
MADNKKILLVDDDPDFMEAVKTILESANYDVTEAYDGEECMEKVGVVKPDLIVLDVMMPGKSGYEVCDLLKDDEATEEIPVILLTAVASKVSSSKYTHRMGMDTQADDYIAKPVQPAELLKRVQAQLGD